MTTPTPDPAATPAPDSAPAAGQGAAGVTVPGPAPIDLGGQPPVAGTATGDGTAPAPSPNPKSGTVGKTGRYLRDLAERVAATFIQAFVGGVVITQPLDRSMWWAAAAGGIGAVLAVLKGLVARWQGDGSSASLADGV